MNISFAIEYFGNCMDAINFYGNIFDDFTCSIKKFKEMPKIDNILFSDSGLEMVWSSNAVFTMGNFLICFELSDSIISAMQSSLYNQGWRYNPVIILTHNDLSFVKKLFLQLKNANMEHTVAHDMQLTGVHDLQCIDEYGTKWLYKQSNEIGIHYSLTFSGFCADVISFYEDAFGIKAIDIVHYKNSKKIKSAKLQFANQDKSFCSIYLCDSEKSAIDDLYEYDPTELLFYQRFYNPIINIRDIDAHKIYYLFDKLKVGGKINSQIDINSNNELTASLIDKYGICWNLYLQ